MTSQMNGAIRECLFVGPLAQELPADCLDWFMPQVSCVVPQGWCRDWSESRYPSDVNVCRAPPAGFADGLGRLCGVGA